MPEGNGLEGKSALVTGAGRGIGRAAALELAARGCDLVIASRTAEELDSTRMSVEKLGRRCAAVQADITKPRDIERIVSRMRRDFGSIDFLVNNAGVAVYRPMMDTSEEIWDRTMNTNLKAVFMLTKAVLPFMNKGGRIVNVSSLAGRHGNEGLSAYCASKFGVIGLSESLAQEIENEVYVICPGSVETRMYASLFPGDPAKLQPHEVARVIADVCESGSRERIIEVRGK